MISAYGTEETRKETVRIGAYDFIDKPFKEVRERIIKKAKGNSKIKSERR